MRGMREGEFDGDGGSVANSEPLLSRDSPMPACALHQPKHHDHFTEATPPLNRPRKMQQRLTPDEFSRCS